MRSLNPFQRRVVLALLVVFAAASALLIVPGSSYGAPRPTKAERSPGPDADWESGFVSAVEAVERSVVTIVAPRNTGKDTNGRGGDLSHAFPPDMPSPFNESLRGFFENEFLFDIAPYAGWGDRALGSGVLVDDKGHVLTNNHVVTSSPSTSLMVWLADNRRLPAKLVGADASADLAVLKVDPKELKNLRPAKMGDSNALKVGQWVAALGRPLGADVILTAGIISAKGRAGSSGAVQYEDLIQTDAAIGPTQSGGPLINLRGEVVGITTAVRSRGVGNPGLGLAMTSSKATQVLNRLVGGSDSKATDARTSAGTGGYLGIVVQEIDEGLAGSFGFDRSGGRDGILVSEVRPDSPAAKSGLKSGDIIVRFDGKDAADVSAFRSHVASLKPGTKVTAEIWRDGKSQKLDVELGQAPTGSTAAPGNRKGSAQQPEKPDLFGLSLTDPTPELRRSAGVADDAAGAYITAVAPGSLAATLGLRPGDIVIEVQGKPVKDATEARAEIAKMDPSKGMRLRVQRGDAMRFVFLKMSSPGLSLPGRTY